MERRIRPPSSGYPGIILKAASERLMYPSQTNMACSGVSGAAPMRHPSAQATASERQPMTALENGPTMPTRNSVLASSGSFSIWATPPNAKSVIALVVSPRVRATNACDSSCASKVTKKRRDVKIESDHITVDPHSLWLAWNCEPRDMVISSAMMNQL